MPTTITTQELIKSARTVPDLVAAVGTSGWTQEPALTIVNDVMQNFLAEGLPWKFNRALIKPFNTHPLQQDYIVETNDGNAVTDLGWLESCQRIDINNTADPKPIFPMEAGKDLPITSWYTFPFKIAWIPIPLMRFGTWEASTAYPSGLGGTSVLPSPYQQFIDANGNYLYVSAVTGDMKSGTVEPVAAVGAAYGTLVVDNHVTWKVADPTAVGLRIYPLASPSGLCWEVHPVYQKKPPIISSLQTVLSPIPNELGFLLRAGFIAGCRVHMVANKEAITAYQMWQAALQTAVRSGDREIDEYGLFPSSGIAGSSIYQILPIGPAWPYGGW